MTMNSPQSVLITGGAGFVGSSLALRLKQDRPGARVIALDNLKRRGSELNVPRLQGAGVEFVHGDVRQASDLDAVGRVDALIECSAEPSVLAGYGGSPRYVIDTNLSGTVNCLEFAREHSAAVIFLSTSRIYPIEALNQLPCREAETRFELTGCAGIAEDFSLAGTRSMYGATKLASELILQEYVAMYDLNAVVNRCGVIAGPWQFGKVDQGVVALWVARHLWGDSLTYIGFGGTGKQVRDLLHIDDLYDLVTTQLDQINEIRGETFNVGGGRRCSVSLRELTALCCEHTGRQIPIESEPQTRPADLRIYLTDTSKVRARMAWEPQRTVADIVVETSAWLRAQAAELRPILG